MATSDSGDERGFEQPIRKKRRAAQAAEAKLKEFGKKLGDTGGETEEFEDPGTESASGKADSESASGKRDRNGTKSASGKNVQETSRRRSQYEEEEDSGQENSDDDENEELESDEEGDDLESEGERPGKSSSASKRSQKEKGHFSSEYHDFAPPPFLQKILAKRQREMDNIRRQLPVDSRSREQKLADWYRMLSKLDKPVALLSLISPPQQD